MLGAESRFRFYDPRAAGGRVLLGVTIGVCVALVLHVWFSWTIAVLGGWNALGITVASIAWRGITACDALATARRAAAEDPGRTSVYALVVLTSAASLLAATVLVSRARDLHANVLVLLALCLVTVMVSWTLTHTAFTLRYAHLFYREDDEGVGGIEFPGGANPCYSDFAYLAFTIGMCFQVSDVTISSRQIRTAVLFHAVLSFFYNTAILAFVLNLVFGRVG
ncbi:MAG: DUF1345 domain-containing protein [Polyangia bacterium]